MTNLCIRNRQQICHFSLNLRLTFRVFLPPYQSLYLLASPHQEELFPVLVLSSAYRKTLPLFCPFRRKMLLFRDSIGFHLRILLAARDAFSWAEFRLDFRRMLRFSKNWNRHCFRRNCSFEKVTFYRHLLSLSEHWTRSWEFLAFLCTTRKASVCVDKLEFIPSKRALQRFLLQLQLFFGGIEFSDFVILMQPSWKLNPLQFRKSYLFSFIISDAKFDIQIVCNFVESSLENIWVIEKRKKHTLLSLPDVSILSLRYCRYIFSI